MIAKQIDLLGYSDSNIAGLNGYKLKNSNDIEVLLTNFGPSIVSLKTPGKTGVENIVLAYDNINDLLKDQSEHGRLITGRVCNRIGYANYQEPDGQIVRLDANCPSDDPKHTLHSGQFEDRWSHQIWEANAYTDNGAAVIEFSYTSPAGHQKFPGEVKIKLKVTLTDQNELKLQYTATTDHITPINPTCHIYWNPNGVGSGQNITNCMIYTTADRYLQVDDDLIPTGKILPVGQSEDGFLDFTTTGRRIGDNKGKGHDNNLVFKPGTEHLLRLFSPLSRRLITQKTDQNADQLYTGLWLNKPFNKFDGVCLEASDLVDIINHPEWWEEFKQGQWWEQYGKPFLRPGDNFSHVTTYKFELV